MSCSITSDDAANTGKVVSKWDGSNKSIMKQIITLNDVIRVALDEKSTTKPALEYQRRNRDLKNCRQNIIIVIF